MLQQIRDKISGWFATVFLGAIAVVFIFWGIQFESAVDVGRRQGERRGASRRAGAPRLAGAPDRAAAGRCATSCRPSSSRRAGEAARRLHPPRAAGAARPRDAATASATANSPRRSTQIPALQVDGKFSRDRYAALLRAAGPHRGRVRARVPPRPRDRAAAATASRISAFVTPGELGAASSSRARRATSTTSSFPPAQFAGAGRGRRRPRSRPTTRRTRRVT